MNPSDPQPETIEATLESRTKPWWQSKTILGSAAAILTTLLGIFFQTDFRQDEVAELVFGLAAVAGSSLAIYGRIKARTEIAPKAVRATPQEIAAARRGGSFKGSTAVEFLVPLGLTILFLALAGWCAGCTRYGNPANAARRDVLSGRQQIKNTQEAITYPGNEGRQEELRKNIENEQLLIATNLAAIHRSDITPSLLETERIQLTVLSPVGIAINFAFGVVTWPVAALASAGTAGSADGALWPFTITAWTARSVGDEYGEIKWLEGATK